MTTRRKPSASLTRIMNNIDEDKLRRTRDRMLVANKIADALKAKGISQKKFSEMTGRSESEVSEWLSGDRNFTIDTLSDIINSLTTDDEQIDVVNKFYVEIVKNISSKQFDSNIKLFLLDAISESYDKIRKSFEK